VDYKIMVTFLEFYETLVGFINYKLYADENLAYPPALDMSKEAGAAGLAAFTLQRKDAVGKGHRTCGVLQKYARC